MEESRLLKDKPSHRSLSSKSLLQTPPSPNPSSGKLWELRTRSKSPTVKSSKFKRSSDRRRSRLRTLVSTLSTTLTLVTRICSRNTELTLFKVLLTKCITKWVVTTESPETESRLSRPSKWLWINSESKNQDVCSIRILSLCPSLSGKRTLDLLFLSTELTSLNLDHQLLKVVSPLKSDINNILYNFFRF